MFSVFAFSFFSKRKTNVFNSLASAGLIMLFLNPLSLFNVGFQLSFLSVFAIILSCKIFYIRASSNPNLNYIKQIFFCSLFVSLFITPLVSYYFGRVYILSIFYNVILIPFFTFILAVNFLLIIFSPIKWIAQSFGLILSLSIKIFGDFLRILGGLKLSFVSYSFKQLDIVVYYLALAGILGYLLTRQLIYLPESAKIK